MSTGSLLNYTPSDSDTSDRTGKLERELAAWVDRPSLQETEPEPAPIIEDPNLRRGYARSEAREGQRAARRLALATPGPEPVRATTQADHETIPYAHGTAMRLTLAKVCARPDVSSKAKHVAITLSAHYPNVMPSIKRLQLLTGIKSNSTINLALMELRGLGLLTWTHGNSSCTNNYQCLWITPTA